VLAASVGVAGPDMIETGPWDRPRAWSAANLPQTVTGVGSAPAWTLSKQELQ